MRDKISILICVLLIVNPCLAADESRPRVNPEEEKPEVEAQAEEQSPSLLDRLFQFIPSVDVKPTFTEPQTVETDFFSSPNGEGVGSTTDSQTGESNVLLGAPTGAGVTGNSNAGAPSSVSGSSSGNGSGAGAGAGAGGAGAGGGSFSGGNVANEAVNGAPAGAFNGGNVADEAVNGAPRGPTGTAGTVTGGGQGGPGGEPFPLVYAMCLFMDADVVSQEQGNAAVKGLIDRAAACEVNLVVYPVTVKPGSYSSEESEANINAINEAQKAACNIPGALGGFDRASTSFCANATKFSDVMCDQRIEPPVPPGGTQIPREQWPYDTETAGCAQVQAKAGEDVLVNEEIKNDFRNPTVCPGYPDTPVEQCQAYIDRMLEINQHTDGSSTSTEYKITSNSGVAPSIEDTGSCTPGTVGHEALGHSMFGHPNGAGDGHGIGVHKGESDGEMWTPAGCAAMRRNAMPNDGTWKYNPNRTQYYRRVANPENQFDLMSAQPIFGPNTEPPTPTGGGNTGDGVQIGFDDTRKRITGDRRNPNGVKNQPGGTPIQETAAADIRHKKNGAGGGSVADRLLAGLQEQGPNQDNRPSGEVQNIDGKASAGEAKGGGSGVALGFDDSRKKGANVGGSNVGVGSDDVLVNTGPTPGVISGAAASFIANPFGTGGTGSGDNQGIGFDDSRKKGANVGGSDYYSGGSVVVGGGGPSNLSSIGTADPFESQLEDGFFDDLSRGDQRRNRDKIQDWRRKPGQGGGYSYRPRTDADSRGAR